MRSSIVCDESNALPMSGSATLATERLRLATEATRISARRISVPRAGALSRSPPASGAVTERTLSVGGTPAPHPFRVMTVGRRALQRLEWRAVVDAGAAVESEDDTRPP